MEVVLWAGVTCELSLNRWQESFPAGSDGQESACDATDPGSIHGLGRSPGEGNPGDSTPVLYHSSTLSSCLLQYSFLENCIDRRAWRATSHVVSKRHEQVILEEEATLKDQADQAEWSQKLEGLEQQVKDSGLDPIINVGVGQCLRIKKCLRVKEGETLGMLELGVTSSNSASTWD